MEVKNSRLPSKVENIPSIVKIQRLKQTLPLSVSFSLEGKKTFREREKERETGRG